MICSLCQKEFDEQEAEAGCKSCGLHGGCHLIKCPYCAYEQPLVPRWLKKLREMLSKKQFSSKSDVIDSPK
jgi:hypothetical protein